MRRNDRLYSLRTTMAFTQSRMAQRLLVSTDHYAQIERGALPLSNKQGLEDRVTLLELEDI